jgi:hypothetical protein
MRRSMFGGNSNLPPGCTSRDIERAYGGRDPTSDEERVLELLEGHGVPADICDEIMKIIDGLYIEIARLLAAPDPFSAEAIE